MFYHKKMYAPCYWEWKSNEMPRLIDRSNTKTFFMNILYSRCSSIEGPLLSTLEGVKLVWEKEQSDHF